jgi:phage terminase large subunit
MKVCRSVVENKRTTVRAGHGVGKSWLSARLVLWFLYCFYPSKVLSTAPQWSQVEKILWSEINSAYNSARYPLGGTCLTTNLKLADDWFATGISTRESVEQREFGATKMQGFHSPNLLIVLDEAAGVPPEIWKASESLVTGKNNKILAIGNPASPVGPFFDTFKSPVWSKIQLNCFDHPNVVNKQEIVPGCVTWEWIEERIKEWGEDSPIYKAKVLGEFPEEGEDVLIPLGWVEKAMELDLKPKNEIRRVGVDVARYGDDTTVGYRINEPVAELVFETAKEDTMKTVGRTIRVADEEDQEADYIGIDDTGVGGGVTDRLDEQGYDVDAINFGAKANEPDKFFNLKAELFWILRDRLKPGSDDPLKLPYSEKLLSELSDIRYSINSKGQIKIESKDDMKKRGKKSPNHADALAIANGAGRHYDEPSIHVL